MTEAHLGPLLLGVLAMSLWLFAGVVALVNRSRS